MKKPHKWERVGIVDIAFDEWGFPLYYIRPVKEAFKVPERHVETFK